MVPHTCSCIAEDLSALSLTLRIMCAPQIEGTDEAYCKCTAGFMGPDCTAAYMECDKGLVCYNGGQCTAGDSPDTQTCGCPRECRAWWFHLCAVRSRGSLIAPAVTCNGCLRLLPTRHAVHATNSAAGSGHPAGGVLSSRPASLSSPPGVESQPLPCVLCSWPGYVCLLSLTLLS